MKFILEILLAVVLHPLAFVLMLLNLFRRGDLSNGRKVLWALVGVLWGVGPILYLLFGEGQLW